MEPASPRTGIALDSQCLTYLIDAFEDVEPPKDALADQKVALARAYFYTPGTLWVTPTVELEFMRIRDSLKKAKHVSWTSTIFGVRPLGSRESVERRAAELLPLHHARGDCLVLAEAENIGVATLLTFDNDFASRLAGAARLDLTSPGHFWTTLGVAKGAKPDKVPTPDNPLAKQDWWRW